MKKTMISAVIKAMNDRKSPVEPLPSDQGRLDGMVSNLVVWWLFTHFDGSQYSR